jgi:hypothetical protein
MEELGLQDPVMEQDPGVEDYIVPDVLLTAIRDGVVAERTRKVYAAESFSFLKWLRKEEPTALSPYGLGRMNKFIDDAPVGINDRKLYTLSRVGFDELLRGCDIAPILDFDNLTPEVYINYVRQLLNKKTGHYLGKSSIGGKRASLFHLYRLHNGAGYSDAFNNTLNNLFRGLFRVLATRSGSQQTVVVKDGVATMGQQLPKWNQVNIIFIQVFIFFT